MPTPIQITVARSITPPTPKRLREIPYGTVVNYNPAGPERRQCIVGYSSNDETGKRQLISLADPSYIWCPTEFLFSPTDILGIPKSIHLEF